METLIPPGSGSRTWASSGGSPAEKTVLPCRPSSAETVIVGAVVVGLSVSATTSIRVVVLPDSGHSWVPMTTPELFGVG